MTLKQGRSKFNQMIPIKKKMPNEIDNLHIVHDNPLCATFIEKS